MATLIESLLQVPVKRADDRLLSVTKRPPPMRARDIFEVFGALGQTASMQAFHRSIELNAADPRELTFAALGRWPTTAELAALEDPYNAWRHLQAMIRSDEFRLRLVRRMLETYPELQRLFHIRIPSCAGRHVMDMLDATFAVLPTDFADPRYATPTVYAPFMGKLCGRMGSARRVAITAPHLAAFVATPPSLSAQANALQWDAPIPPCRAIDTVFAMIRPPADLALSQVNATLTLLQSAEPPPHLVKLVSGFGKIPPKQNLAAWSALGRRLLAECLPQNPICSALADGTAAGALAACAWSPVELLDLSRYDEWSRTTYGAVTPPIGASHPFLKSADLTAQDRAAISAAMGEDEIFYARFAAAYAKADVPALRGRDIV